MAETTLSPAGDARLLLLADTVDDVPLISALVQDAVVHAADIAWEPKARRLVLLLNRFRWEAGDATRIRTALRLENVTRLQRRGWPHGDAILALLAITVDADAITLSFAVGPTLRAEIECVDLILEDMSEPWPALRQPHHDAR